MKTESKTPRTDAQITGLVRLYPQSLCQTEVVSATFAREIETECAAWKKCAMQLADCGDPKPWKIEGWNAAKKEIAKNEN